MEHIGIDLGARHSHLVVLSEAGKTLLREKVETSDLPRWLSRRAASHVVMEACTQSPAVAAAALSAGHDARVVPGQLVRALGVGARGIKTDERDAETLARASVRNEDLPSVHLRSEQSRSRREILSARATLLEARKSIALSVKSWLRGRLVVLKGRASSKAFCDAVRHVALEHPEGLPMAIETLLVTFEHLCEQIEKLDEQIHELAQHDSVCQLLMTMPGVGANVSLSFTTHLDDPLRFASSDELASYLALVPGENTTGGKLKRTGTIHAGPVYLKALLMQSAWSMYRTRPNDPAVLWMRAIADKRGKRIAVVALARKIATDQLIAAADRAVALNQDCERSAQSLHNSPFRTKDRSGAPTVMTATSPIRRLRCLQDDLVDYEYGSPAEPQLRQTSANSRLLERASASSPGTPSLRSPSNKNTLARTGPSLTARPLHSRRRMTDDG